MGGWTLVNNAGNAPGAGTSPKRRRPALTKFAVNLEARIFSRSWWRGIGWNGPQGVLDRGYKLVFVGSDCFMNRGERFSKAALAMASQLWAARLAGEASPPSSGPASWPPT